MGRIGMEFSGMGAPLGRYVFMATALDVATWFLCDIDRSAGDSITHLKVQKLVYYAQAWSLTFLEKPLFSEDMQAWAHGPVAPSVYRAFAGEGWNALDAPDRILDGCFDEDQVALLAEVADVYGRFSARHLENMTHAEAPWRDARGDLADEAPSMAIIPKERMRNYYKGLTKHAEEQG
jgi:uncharacterized phage-associated protein